MLDDLFEGSQFGRTAFSKQSMFEYEAFLGGFLPPVKPLHALLEELTAASASNCAIKLFPDCSLSDLPDEFFLYELGLGGEV